MKLLLFAVIGLTYPILCPAIQCYVCNHSDNPIAQLVGIPNDNNCKKADDKYLRECSDSDIRSLTADRSMLTNFTDSWKTDTFLAGDQRQSNYSCVVATSKSGNYTTVERLCIKYQSDICEVRPITNGTSEVCICNTDKCNNSNTVSSSVTAVLFTTFFLIISNSS
ncbi:uncharacterized protein LOC119078742 [Bradysia coprophila]|uniref:uncharacterized protein LOC119078742 n=1 Tax=Bradysia coprophila TaxID=38358 RepID=UPI00187D9DB0|nr:uncharacterized protein LOC119078742 [Bradysia coprophila]